MFTGFEFNGKHSYKDFGLTIEDRHIGHPSKIKIMERIPKSNIEYDFSTLYGDQEYSERELSYIININNPKANEHFYLYETAILQWLMEPNQKIILKDDVVSGYHFLAEVVTSPEGEHLHVIGGKVTIAFTAYPFKISNLPEGHDIWDEVNFLLDYLQPVSFDISGRQSITLYNNSPKLAYPTIIATSPMAIEKGGVVFNIPAGENKSDDFFLDKGEVRMSIVGNGNISFIWHKELI